MGNSATSLGKCLNRDSIARIFLKEDPKKIHDSHRDTRKHNENDKGVIIGK